MLAFLAPAALPAPLRHPLPHHPPNPTPPPRCSKRLRMLASGRSQEFSLNDPNPRNTSPPPTPLDWNNWRTTGCNMTIPAIPFPPEQVFMPGEAKRLHLFEARYLALFEHVIVHCDKRCAHVLIDPVRQAMAAHGAIIHVCAWRRLDLGITVDFEAVGRMKTSSLHSSSPFLRTECETVADIPLDSDLRFTSATRLVHMFWPALRNAVDLSIKLGEDPTREKIDTATSTVNAVQSSRQQLEGPNPAKPESLATDNSLFLLSADAKKQLFEQNLKQAARRAVNFEPLEFNDDEQDEEMLARKALALSFAGWDFFPSHYGLRQRAIEERDTVVRLANVVDGLERHGKKLAAKLALRDAFSP